MRMLRASVVSPELKPDASGPQAVLLLHCCWGCWRSLLLLPWFTSGPASMPPTYEGAMGGAEGRVMVTGSPTTCGCASSDAKARCDGHTPVAVHMRPFSTSVTTALPEAQVVGSLTRTVFWCCHPQWSCIGYTQMKCKPVALDGAAESQHAPLDSEVCRQSPEYNSMLSIDGTAGGRRAAGTLQLHDKV